MKYLGKVVAAEVKEGDRLLCVSFSYVHKSHSVIEFALTFTIFIICCRTTLTQQGAQGAKLSNGFLQRHFALS